MILFFSRVLADSFVARHVLSENVISVGRGIRPNGGHPIHNLSDKIGRVSPRPSLTFSFSAFLLLPFPLEFRLASVLSSRSNKSYRYHHPTSSSCFAYPTVVRVASTKVFRIVSLTVLFGSYTVRCNSWNERVCTYIKLLKFGNSVRSGYRIVWNGINRRNIYILYIRTGDEIYRRNL